MFDDASELADGELSDPLARVTAALAKRLDLEPRHDRIAAGASLDDWRATYTTVGAHDAWRVHGAWIDAAKPHFGTAIAERWQAASRVGETEAAMARAAIRDIRVRVRDALGTGAIAVLPSAASLAPLRAADAAQVQAVRMRTMAITCIAGLAGLPQVSLPFARQPATVGVSLLGPAGSDRTLIDWPHNCMATRLTPIAPSASAPRRRARPSPLQAMPPSRPAGPRRSTKATTWNAHLPNGVRQRDEPAPDARHQAAGGCAVRAVRRQPLGGAQGAAAPGARPHRGAAAQPRRHRRRAHAARKRARSSRHAARSRRRSSRLAASTPPTPTCRRCAATARTSTQAMHRFDQPAWARLASGFHLHVATLAGNPSCSGYLVEIVSRCSLIVALLRAARQRVLRARRARAHRRLHRARRRRRRRCALMDEHLRVLERHSIWMARRASAAWPSCSAWPDRSGRRHAGSCFVELTRPWALARALREPAHVLARPARLRRPSPPAVAARKHRRGHLRHRPGRPLHLRQPRRRATCWAGAPSEVLAATCTS